MKLKKKNMRKNSDERYSGISVPVIQNENSCLGQSQIFQKITKATIFILITGYYIPEYLAFLAKKLRQKKFVI